MAKLYIFTNEEILSVPWGAGEPTVGGSGGGTPSSHRNEDSAIKDMADRNSTRERAEERRRAAAERRRKRSGGGCGW